MAATSPFATMFEVGLTSGNPVPLTSRHLIPLIWGFNFLFGRSDDRSNLSRTTTPITWQPHRHIWHPYKKWVTSPQQTGIDDVPLDPTSLHEQSFIDPISSLTLIVKLLIFTTHIFQPTIVGPRVGSNEVEARDILACNDDRSWQYLQKSYTNQVRTSKAPSIWAFDLLFGRYDGRSNTSGTTCPLWQPQWKIWHPYQKRDSFVATN